ncbi:MAG: HAD-IB family hydrolase [Caulobacteraceae bacterium]
MGTDPADRQRRGARRPLVAFDFDGTLTTRDSFRDFLAWRGGPVRYGLGVARLAPALAEFALRRDRQRLKEATTKVFLAGVAKDDLAAEAARYAAERSGALLRPDALACWKRWQAAGARLLIVTASPETIVAPFAHGLDAWRLIGTRLAFDGRGRVTGGFEGANCRGPEKVRRLRAELGVDVRLKAAYGDSDGDAEMLQLAEERGYRTFGVKR